MNFVTISVKKTFQTPSVILTNLENRLLLRKVENEIVLDSLDTTTDNILPDMGSSTGNVLFFLESEFRVDPSLQENMETGVLEFKEPGRVIEIDVTKVSLGANKVLSFYFDDFKTAKSFVMKKIFGEMYLLKSAEQNSFPFYPQSKEAYLFSSSFVEVGFLSYLDNEDVLLAPSATITELHVEPDDKKAFMIRNIDFSFELPVRKKYRLDFLSGSGLNIIRMNRGRRAVKDSAGNVYWEIHDEIFKIFVGKE